MLKNLIQLLLSDNAMEALTPNRLEYRCRNLIFNDFHSLKILCDECLESSNYPDEYFYSILNPEYYFSLGIFIHDQLIAFISSRLESSYGLEGKIERAIINVKQSELVSYINLLCVDKKHRNKGIASYLMKKVENYHNGFENLIAIYLHVMVNNENAISLYSKLGFKPLCRIQKFYKFGNDEFIDAYLYVNYIRH